jgi:septal ring factor EnvC (AmiA/AmiB activator)
MSNNYIKQLEDLKEKAQKNKEEKIRLEQQLKSLEEQNIKLIEELIPLEVKPEDLEKVVGDLTKQIEAELTQLMGFINE